MDFEDKTLTCKECSNDFVWSVGEQKFFADKGLQNPPGRCPDCRKMAREKKANQPKYKIVCKQCGKEGEVPFEPFNPKDVLCVICWDAQRRAQAAV